MMRNKIKNEEIRTALTQILTAFTILYFSKLFLGLNIIITILTGISFLLFLFLSNRQSREQKKQQTRFEEVCIYLNSLLAAFSREAKLIRALEAAMSSMPEGNLKEILGQTVEWIYFGAQDEQAIAVLEKEYDCRRMANIHRFMTQVEHYGGKTGDMIPMLMEDKNRWELRIRQQMKEDNQLYREIILSVIASLFICGAILHMPGVGISIQNNPVSQGASLITILLDEIILYRAKAFLIRDWLNLEDKTEGNRKELEAYYNRDEQKERRLSLYLMLLPVPPMLFLFWKEKLWAAGFCFLLLLIFSNQDRLGKKIQERRITEEIQRAFPNWLLDLILLLQSENVRMAMERSVERAPEILKEEILELCRKIDDNPDSGQVYQSFLHDFHLPQVHALMSVLYSLASGNSVSSETQLIDLMKIAHEMQDLSSGHRLKEKSSSLYLLFLAPVLTASFKMLVDMSICLLGFLAWKI